MASARISLLITGRVHGVGFRSSTRYTARQYNLVGYVKNIPEGVEMVAEGPKEILETFVMWCKRGPSFSRVKDVHVSWELPTGEFSTFEIR